MFTWRCGDVYVATAFICTWHKQRRMSGTRHKLTLDISCSRILLTAAIACWGATASQQNSLYRMGVDLSSLFGQREYLHYEDGKLTVQ
jgi:hypothetical protein